MPENIVAIDHDLLAGFKAQINTGLRAYVETNINT